MNNQLVMFCRSRFLLLRRPVLKSAGFFLRAFVEVVLGLIKLLEIAVRKPYAEMQNPRPCSVKLWPEQLRELDFACKALGISRSRLLRHGALCVARELRDSAERPLRLHR
jgi:hypothetical protein